MPRQIIRRNTHGMIFALMGGNVSYGANRSTDELHLLPTGNGITQSFAPLDRTFKNQLFQSAQAHYQRGAAEAIDEVTDIGDDLSQEMSTFLPLP
ncbi:hypothetical protein [Legionella tunisiensis]|uniref:hypothetical protein n=1 Tax=Legionella tunisiensis TaxID=1034944 RepID=UPI0002E41C3C|nr:hypothetical protein [Legionella tunisiensis]